MIQRDIQKELSEHLTKPEITVLTGPRQSGKTTILKLLEKDLQAQMQKTVFLNLDMEESQRILNSQASLIKFIELKVGQDRGYVFIDEIQRKENAGLFLKGIYDMELPYKFIVSGSGSLDLKAKIHESLAGRKRVFELSTLSFVEFANWETNYEFQDRMAEYLAFDEVSAKQLLIKYLEFGGYPKVVLATMLEEKKETIREILNSFLEKDIMLLLGMKHSEIFNDLIRLTASQIGNITNYAELASHLGISAQTVKTYLYYLQETYILNKCTPYYQNIRKEISKSPVFYYHDLGFRNFSLDRFGHRLLPQDYSFLFQNLIHSLLIEKTQKTASKVSFWRTVNGAEVDFILESGNEVLPIEVKYSALDRPIVQRSLRSYIDSYKPLRAIVINLSLDTSIQIENTEAVFMPWYKFLFWSPETN